MIVKKESANQTPAFLASGINLEFLSSSPIVAVGNSLDINFVVDILTSNNCIDLAEMMKKAKESGFICCGQNNLI